MDSVYFDSSVFLAVIVGEKNGPQIRSLLRELKTKRIRIYTSIITLQEISVLSFRRGSTVDDPVSKLHKMARITGVTKEVALTAAKLEAQLKDLGKAPKEIDRISENRRRKWDCFHIATAMVLNCSTMFSSDEDFLKRRTQLGLSMEFSKPVPSVGELDLRAPKPEGKSDGKDKEPEPEPPELPGGRGGHSKDQDGAEVREKYEGKEVGRE